MNDKKLEKELTNNSYYVLMSGDGHKYYPNIVPTQSLDILTEFIDYYQDDIKETLPWGVTIVKINRDKDGHATLIPQKVVYAFTIPEYVDKFLNTYNNEPDIELESFSNQGDGVITEDGIYYNDIAYEVSRDGDVMQLSNPYGWSDEKGEAILRLREDINDLLTVEIYYNENITEEQYVSLLNEIKVFSKNANVYEVKILENYDSAPDIVCPLKYNPDDTIKADYWKHLTNSLRSIVGEKDVELEAMQDDDDKLNFYIWKKSPMGYNQIGYASSLSKLADKVLKDWKYYSKKLPFTINKYDEDNGYDKKDAIIEFNENDFTRLEDWALTFCSDQTSEEKDIELESKTDNSKFTFDIRLSDKVPHTGYLVTGDDGHYDSLIDAKEAAKKEIENLVDRFNNKFQRYCAWIYEGKNVVGKFNYDDLNKKEKDIELEAINVEDTEYLNVSPEGEGEVLSNITSNIAISVKRFANLVQVFISGPITEKQADVTYVFVIGMISKDPTLRTISVKNTKTEATEFIARNTMTSLKYTLKDYIEKEQNDIELESFTKETFKHYLDILPDGRDESNVTLDDTRCKELSVVSLSKSFFNKGVIIRIYNTCSDKQYEVIRDWLAYIGDKLDVVRVIFPSESGINGYDSTAFLNTNYNTNEELIEDILRFIRPDLNPDLSKVKDVELENYDEFIGKKYVVDDEGYWRNIRGNAVKDNEALIVVKHDSNGTNSIYVYYPKHITEKQYTTILVKIRSINRDADLANVYLINSFNHTDSIQCSIKYNSDNTIGAGYWNYLTSSLRNLIKTKEEKDIELE